MTKNNPKIPKIVPIGNVIKWFMSDPYLLKKYNKELWELDSGGSTWKEKQNLAHWLIERLFDCVDCKTSTKGDPKWKQGIDACDYSKPK